jgi:hypothetical protein
MTRQQFADRYLNPPNRIRYLNNCNKQRLDVNHDYDSRIVSEYARGFYLDSCIEGMEQWIYISEKFRGLKSDQPIPFKV